MIATKRKKYTHVNAQSQRREALRCRVRRDAATGKELLLAGYSIVAVHGLGGEWEHTWTAVLPYEFSNARIMSYGYEASTFFTQSITDVTNEAEILLSRLRVERSGKTSEEGL
ncbi:hypothetical protein BDV29DRAFT_125325 [Aspergillus leporis]|jgi:hypothetical protein|uniref:Uncharacterized protein n=1 Tax=Aspergillus leporis TaxID=41062 RepID=A0A5N5X0E2_9EURO|nr:hypothetical protein BDV29DRAFT_125325 [Aspergillus leporis]